MINNYLSNTVSLCRLGHKLTFTEKRWALAKDVSMQNEDTFDIYDPRKQEEEGEQPLNLRVCQ